MRAGFFEVCDSVKQSTSPVRLLDSSQRGGNGVLPTHRNSVDILFFFSRNLPWHNRAATRFRIDHNGAYLKWKASRNWQQASRCPCSFLEPTHLVAAPISA